LTAVTQGYSREVETAADRKGAQTCAQAGSNPYGMIWLFEAFEKADTGGQMEMLSDHPTESHRIQDLQRLFSGDPALFGRFSSNIATATPLHRPRSE
jgi:predicted Zn-dependent protease